MKKIFNWLKTEEDGQGMVEYGLIIAGIAIVVMVAIFALGPIISNLFEEVAATIAPAPAP